MSRLPAREDALRGSLLHLDGIVDGGIALKAGIRQIQERSRGESVYFGAGLKMERGVVAGCPLLVEGRRLNGGEAYCASVSFLVLAE